MRSTYYATEDKFNLQKATQYSAVAYIVLIAYIALFIWWDTTLATMLHNESNNTYVLIGMALNFIFSLSLVIIPMLSIVYLKDYNYLRATYDRLLYISKISMLLNIAIIIMTIAFSFINISYMLSVA